MALGKIQRAIINAAPAGAGNVQVVAGIAASGVVPNQIPAQKFYVMSAVIVVSAAGMNPAFRSANNQTTFGPLPLGANGGVVLPMMGEEDEAAWFVTNPGEDLNVNVAAAGVIGGTVFYLQTS